MSIGVQEAVVGRALEVAGRAGALGGGKWGAVVRSSDRQQEVGGNPGGNAVGDADKGNVVAKGADARRRRRKRWVPSMQRQLERMVKRAGREALLRRADFLPPTSRALVYAHLEKGMTLEEIGTLHRVSARQVRRRLTRVCTLLEDTCFVLTVRFGERLPAELLTLARGYWLEEVPLRTLAKKNGQTLYRLRQDLARARSHLLKELASEREVTAEMADRVLESGRKCELDHQGPEGTERAGDGGS